MATQSSLASLLSTALIAFSINWSGDFQKRLVHGEQFKTMMDCGGRNQGIWQFQFTSAAQRYGQILDFERN